MSRIRSPLGPAPESTQERAASIGAASAALHGLPEVTGELLGGGVSSAAAPLAEATGRSVVRLPESRATASRDGPTQIGIHAQEDPRHRSAGEGFHVAVATEGRRVTGAVSCQVHLPRRRSIGKRIVKVVPAPTSLTTSISPPWCSISLREM